MSEISHHSENLPIQSGGSDWSRCSRIAGLPNENPETDPENILRKKRDVEIATVLVSGQTIPASNHP